MEAAERNPALFGFSHVAVCETSFGADGRERVEGLRAIESVDLVAEPATTKGIFEQRRPVDNGNADGAEEWRSSVSRSKFKFHHTNERSAMPVTIRALAEWLTRHPRSTTRQILAAKRLAEMDAGAVGDEPAADALPPEDAEPDDAITGGFKAALVSVIEKALAGDLDATVALKKIKTLLAAHCDATMDDGDSDSDDDANSDANDSSAEQPSSESRRFRSRPGERPASVARHRIARHTETVESPDSFPNDGLSFARWVAE